MPVGDHFTSPFLNDSPLDAHLMMPLDSPDASTLHIVGQAREMTNSPSPLAMLLSDPGTLESTPHRTSTPKKSKRSGSPRRDHKSMNALLYELVGEEERQALHLKSALNSVSDRLQQETQRVNQAVERANYAESRAIEFCSRATIAESALVLAERQIASLKSEIEAIQAQLRMSREDNSNANDQNSRLREECSNVNSSLNHARDTNREYAQLIREYEEQSALEEQEHHRNLQRWYDEGHEYGWRAGNEAGYEKGRRRGRSEGYKDGLRAGREKGRRAERKSALVAFDDFLVAQTHGPDDKLAEMVQRWRNSVYPMSHFEGWDDEGSETDSSISFS